MTYSQLWPRGSTHIERPSQRHDFDAARGLVYSVAIALVVVWFPILYVLSRYDL